MNHKLSFSLVLFVGVSTYLSSSAASLLQQRCPEWAVQIPAGTFFMGTTSQQAYDEDEQPRRRVSLTQAYCIDRTEITVSDYQRCVDAGKCPNIKPAFADDRLPMTQVNWFEAHAACMFRKGRLPTEAEWEYAARGHDDRLFPWGNFRFSCMYADSWGEVMLCNGYGPSPVGSFPLGASPFGVLDLAGNVSEWVDDAYFPDAYLWLSIINPHAKNLYALRRSVRGGSWNFDAARSLRVSERQGVPPTTRDSTIGFRCVYSLL